jgi:hypothetical protein
VASDDVQKSWAAIAAARSVLLPIMAKDEYRLVQ